MERAHAQLIADSVAVNVNVHYKATLEKCGGSALVDLFSSILFLNLSSGAYLSSDAFAIGIGGARCGADRLGDAYTWQDYLLLLAEGSQVPLSMALALRVLTSRLKTAHTYTGSRLDRRRATRSLSKTGMDLSTGILDSACWYCSILARSRLSAGALRTLVSLSPWGWTSALWLQC